MVPRKSSDFVKSFLVGTLLMAALSTNGRASPPRSILFRLRDNLVSVDAAINKRTVSAVLDSGTGAILINRSAAERLGLREGRAIGFAPGGGTKPEAIFPSLIDKVVLGPVTLARVHGIAMSTQNLSRSAGFPIDTLMGTPIFMSGPIRVDYPARRVTFFSPSTSPACRSPISIDILNGVPLATVVLRSTPKAAPTTLHLYVDLGTRHFAAIVGGRFLKTRAGKDLMSRGVPQQIGTGTGGAIAGVSVRVAGLDLGSRRYRNLSIALTTEVAAFNSGSADGSLGVPLWKDGALTFDYQNRRLCLSAETAAKIP